jgi:hypothetical protein
MFHPVFTAPPGTNASTATFEAYLVDTNTGAEIAHSSTGPFVLNWTNIPDGRPELGIAQRIVVSWPVAAANYVLEGAASLDNGPWTVVTNAPVLLDGESAVVLDIGARQTMHLWMAGRSASLLPRPMRRRNWIGVALSTRAGVKNRP